MKKVMLTLGILFIIQSIFSQVQPPGDWIVSLSAGIEAHDKRLFDYSEKESLLQMQPEFWGTYHFGLSIRKKVCQNNRFSSYLGLGVGYENAMFLRPFNHFHFNEDSTKILRNLNRYQKVQFPMTFTVLYQLSDNWIVSGLLASNILLFRSIDHTGNNSEVFPYSENTFEVDDINLRLGINYQVDKWIIGLSSRLVNFQKIDQIIFNDLINDPRTNQTWEWHNPLRFDLTIGYTW